MKQKAFFIVFEGLSFGEKINNSGLKLYASYSKNSFYTGTMQF